MCCNFSENSRTYLQTFRNTHIFVFTDLLIFLNSLALKSSQQHLRDHGLRWNFHNKIKTRLYCSNLFQSGISIAWLCFICRHYNIVSLPSFGHLVWNDSWWHLVVSNSLCTPKGFFPSPPKDLFFTRLIFFPFSGSLRLARTYKHQISFRSPSVLQIQKSEGVS